MDVWKENTLKRVGKDSRAQASRTKESLDYK